MPIFQIRNGKFIKIKERKFDYEKDLQVLVEKNLEEVLGLEFISGSLNNEFSVKGSQQNFYIDTLAFDPQSNSFVIIEYKKDRSFSVIDQGYAYLSALLNNKADFILEYNERRGVSLKRNDIDWSQPRVIFMAKEFTPYQKGAIGFKDLPIELWEVKLMEGNFISFTQIKPAETQESITKVTKGRDVERITQEVKTSTLDDHYRKASPAIKSLIDKLRDRIFLLDENIKEKPVKNYLGYKLNWYNFASMHVYQHKLKLYLRKQNLEKDPEKKFTKVPESYKWGKTPLWWINISKDTEFDYLMEAVRESYEAAPDH